MAEDFLPVFDVDFVGNPPATAAVVRRTAKATTKLGRDLGLGVAMFKRG